MKWRLIHKVLWMLCLSWAPYIAFPSNFYGYSLPITAKNGLNNNTIYDIHYDNKDFIWFATDLGISRYDGFRIRNFPLTSYENKHSDIPVSCAVTSISEGTDGLFYLQLLQGGIIGFDSNLEKYIPIHFDRPLNERSIGSVDIYWGLLFLIPRVIPSFAVWKTIT